MCAQTSRAQKYKTPGAIDACRRAMALRRPNPTLSAQIMQVTNRYNRRINGGGIMTPTMRILRNEILRSLAMISALLFAQSLHASVACPVMIFNGSADQKEISLTFINKAKAPIRRLDFYCQAFSGRLARRSVCGEETGIFYPGSPYPVRFSYPDTGAHAIVVSLRSAQLSEGYMWSSTQDQACRPLRIHVSTK